MALVPYVKPHATPSQQIVHLQRKGLIVSDPNLAAREIESIGYERLRIYFLSRRQIALPGKPFNPGTTYLDIISLYQCDMSLRETCFIAVGQFELLFRNAISEELSQTYGSHPYFDHNAFKSAEANIKAIQAFAKAFENSRDQRARHYKSTYSHPVMPPIWTMKEFLTFGTASRIYQNLSGTTRTAIARRFGVPTDRVFENWVGCLVDLRNMCAHHDRLFNRSFPKQPSALANAGLPIAAPNKLKAILECLDHMLRQTGSPTSVAVQAENLIRRHPAVLLAEAGY